MCRRPRADWPRPSLPRLQDAVAQLAGNATACTEGILTRTPGTGGSPRSRRGPTGTGRGLVHASFGHRGEGGGERRRPNPHPVLHSIVATKPGGDQTESPLSVSTS